MSSVPLSAPIRSLSPMRPLVSGRGRAPPIPSSRTSTTYWSAATSSRIHAQVACACLTMLVSASEQKKYRLASMAAGSLMAGTSISTGMGTRSARARTAGGQAMLGEDRGMQARSELAQVLDTAPGVREGLAEEFPGPVRSGLPALLGKLEVDQGGDQTLLGTVMQVPGNALTRSVGRGNQARPRRYQLLFRHAGGR